MFSTYQTGEGDFVVCSLSSGFLTADAQRRDLGPRLTYSVQYCRPARRHLLFPQVSEKPSNGPRYLFLLCWQGGKWEETPLSSKAERELRTGGELTPGTTVACGSLLSACWEEGRAAQIWRQHHMNAHRKEMPVRAALETRQFLNSAARGDPDTSTAGVAGLPWMLTGARCFPVCSRYHT